MKATILRQKGISSDNSTRKHFGRLLTLLFYTLSLTQLGAAFAERYKDLQGKSYHYYIEISLIYL